MRRRTVSAASRFPLRAAGIDVGSNAMRLLVGEFSGPAAWTTLAEQRVAVRLGASVFGPGGGTLTPDVMEAAVSALAGFRERMSELGVEHYRAATTSAVREASNGSEFVERVLREATIRLEPIPASEEARLVWQAVAATMAVAGARWVLMDLGGGSVEIALADGDEIVSSETHAMGAVRLLAEFGDTTGSPRRFREALGAYVETMHIGARLRAADSGGLVATGGNIEELARLGGASRSNGIARLDTAALSAVIDELAAMTPAERMRQYGLRRDRADVVLPAALVYEHIAHLAGAAVIHVPGVGLKEGLLLDAAAGAQSARNATLG